MYQLPILHEMQEEMLLLAVCSEYIQDHNTQWLVGELVSCWWVAVIDDGSLCRLFGCSNSKEDYFTNFCEIGSYYQIMPKIGSYCEISLISIFSYFYLN